MHSTTVRPEYYPAAEKYLARRDPVLKALIRRVGPCALIPKPDDPFTLLVRCVVSQQISTKAAESIFAKVAARVGNGKMKPAKLATLTAEELRECGLSGAKQRAIAAVIEHATADRAFLKSLAMLPDEDFRTRVTAIKGFGPWSADMLLMFGYARPDVLPVGDYGIRVAFRNLYDLDALPTPAVMTALAEPWRPYRTVASWYLWRSLDTKAEKPHLRRTVS